MGSEPRPGHQFESLLAAGVPADAVEAGQRWVGSKEEHRSVLLVMGGEAPERAAFLEALTDALRASGQRAHLLAASELAEADETSGLPGVLLLTEGDALADDPQASMRLVQHGEEGGWAGLVVALGSASVLHRVQDGMRAVMAEAEVISLGDGTPDEAPAGSDEFGDFLADVSTVVAGLLDDSSARAGAASGWLGAPPPDRSLGDFVRLRGADSVGARVAREVLGGPDAGYNPLTVWAETGAGKTTLLAGIAHAYLERYPDHAVAFVAGGAGAAPESDDLAGADLLLIDDLHELPDLDRVATLVRAITEGPGQVVVATERSPETLDLPRGLEEALLRGAVVGIGMTEQGKEAESAPTVAIRDLLAACGCADWVALDERIIEEPF